MEAPIVLTHPSEVRRYLKNMGFTPTKSLGQNFLVDRNVRELILDAAGIQSGDDVLEIGPGLGVMTEGLLNRGARVQAIEIDHRLVAHLQQQFPGKEDVLRITAADATRIDWEPLLRNRSVRVVSNLPYSVGSRVLYDLAAPSLAPASITVMVQSDVADRLVAKPGTSDWGILGLRMAVMYQAKRIKEIAGSCFVPPPRVGSAVVHLSRRTEAAVQCSAPDLFEAIVKFAFTRRRKQLGSVLREAPGCAMIPRETFADAGIRLEARPGELSLKDWETISDISLAHQNKG